MDETKKKKQGRNIEVIQPEEQVPLVPPPSPSSFNAEEYIVVLTKLRQPIVHTIVVPTDVPKTFIDGLRFYHSGVTIRLYIYINGTWRYVALT